jgi:hypothetical protein
VRRGRGQARPNLLVVALRLCARARVRGGSVGLLGGGSSLSLGGDARVDSDTTLERELGGHLGALLVLEKADHRLAKA